MDPSCHNLPESLSLLSSSFIFVSVSMVHSVSKAFPSSIVSGSLFFLTWCVYRTVTLSSGMCLPVLFFKILPGILPLSICNACCYQFCHLSWYYIEILSSVLVVQSNPLSLHSRLCYTTLSHCLTKIIK